MSVKANLTRNASTKSKGVYYWIQLIFSAIIALLTVLLCFVPMAKIGNFSMGTPIEFVVECFKKEYESSQYLNFGFFVLAFIFIVIVVIRFFVFFASIKRTISWISKEDPVPSFVMWLALFVSCFVGIFLFVSPLNEYYACEIITPYLLIILCFFDVLSYAILLIINKLTHSKEKVKKSHTEQVVAMVMTSIVCVLIIGLFTTLGVYYHNNLVYPDAIKNSGLVKVGEFLVEEKNDYKVTNKFVFKEEMTEKEIILDSSVNEVVGNNNLYYQFKINELTDKMMKMWPEDNDWETYARNIEQLEKDIEYLKNNTPKTYIRVELGELEERWVEVEIDYFGNKKRQCQYGREVIGIEYNQDVNFQDDNGYKWGNKNNNLLSNLFYKEKITLSVMEFTIDTDFSKQEIVAEVHYSDGSMKVSKIIPSNYEDLNNAQTGKNILKWNDKWGEYQVEITISE